MRQARDYSGERFGHWTIIERDNTKQKQWFAKCDCGNICSVNIDNVKAGRSTKCQKCKGKVSHDKMVTHGESKTRLYYVWLSMRNRCYRADVAGYEHYGGRGIKVCDEWKEHFEPFRDWALSHGYKPGLQIDRIDNDGDYCPENCRWATKVQNMNNTSRNKYVLIDGVKCSLLEAEEICHLPRRLIADRLRKGWSIEDAMKYQPKIGNNQNLRRHSNE
jgi:hypothetical protein